MQWNNIVLAINIFNTVIVLDPNDLDGYFMRAYTI
jgi:hypothetical protein